MASAMLASSNEPCWGERNVHMRKAPIGNPSTGSNPNPGTNPNPRYGGRREGYARNPGAGPVGFYQSDPMELDDLPTTPAGLPEDCSSFSHGGDTVGNIVRFNISAYSRRELRDLKRRLELELDLVRRVSSKLEAIFPSPLRPPRTRPDPGSEKALAAILKRCGGILTKMMKQKGAAWFNVPVDVEGMGLHDYYQIVKKPMDLGTIRLKLAKSLYRSPMDFATDVRLTFNNALLYNPQGHEVNRIAGLLLKLFDKEFSIALDRHHKQQTTLVNKLGEKKHAYLPSAVRPLPAPSPEHITSPLPYPSRDGDSNCHSYPSQQEQQRMVDIGPEAKCSLPNPKPNGQGEGGKKKKPAMMTTAEREKLGEELMNLTGEHMEQMMSFLTHNKYLEGDSGEVELDLSAMGNELLWQIHGIVADYNKKMRKSPVMGPGGTPDTKMNNKKGDGEDEDIDICDDMPSTNYPPVEIDKDEGGYASSSDSDDSDSSDSDSDSDSDNEDEG